MRIVNKQKGGCVWVGYDNIKMKSYSLLSKNSENLHGVISEIKFSFT